MKWAIFLRRHSDCNVGTIEKGAAGTRPSPVCHSRAWPDRCHLFVTILPLLRQRGAMCSLRALSRLAGLACTNSVTSGASESEAPAEAAHCAASNRSCCRIHAEGPPREANDPSPGNLDSGTARSNRANTASFSSLKSEPNPLAQKSKSPQCEANQPGRCRDCAGWLLVCQEKSILLVGVLLHGTKRWGNNWVL